MAQNDCTLITSFDKASLLTPCRYTLHLYALKQKTPLAHVLGALHYIASPFDRLIQAVALPILTVKDHIEDIQEPKKKHKIYRIVLPPFTLPFKVLAATLGSAYYLGRGILALIAPIEAVYAAIHGKKASHQFFLQRHIARSEELSQSTHDLLPFIESAYLQDYKRLKDQLKAYKTPEALAYRRHRFFLPYRNNPRDALTFERYESLYDFDQISLAEWQRDQAIFAHDKKVWKQIQRIVGINLL